MEKAAEELRHEIAAYFVAFGEGGLSKMSGPLSVVIAGIGLFFPSIPGRVLFFVLAAVAFVVASFDVWRRERLKNLHPPLSQVVVERRKSIKDKYDKLGPDGQAVMRQIVIDGSVPDPMLHMGSPDFWWAITSWGLADVDHLKRYVLVKEISDDITAVIEDEIRSSQAVPPNPEQSP